MNDYIDRKDLINSIGKDTAPFTVSMVFRHIRNAPAADVVEVVRCKNCKYCDYKPSVIGCACFKDGLLRNTKENDFCSYGERREDNA